MAYKLKLKNEMNNNILIGGNQD